MSQHSLFYLAEPYCCSFFPPFYKWTCCFVVVKSPWKDLPLNPCESHHAAITANSLRHNNSTLQHTAMLSLWITASPVIQPAKPGTLYWFIFNSKISFFYNTAARQETNNCSHFQIWTFTHTHALQTGAQAFRKEAKKLTRKEILKWQRWRYQVGDREREAITVF